MVKLTGDLIMAETEKKQLKTFSLHEKNMKYVAMMKKAVLRYKHVENMLNIILNRESDIIFALPADKRDYTVFNLLTNSIIMKAVISGNNGGEKTQKGIAQCKAHLELHHKDLYQQLLSEGQQLNDKNISQVITRLAKDWKNSLKNLKAYYADKKGSKFTGKPSTPKAKKLSKVFNYSVPLEVSKFSLQKKNRLGINIWKKMEYVFFRDNDYLKDKTINNVTVALSHGHIYYQLSYQNKKNDKAEQKNNAVLPVCKPEKTAGLDIGVHHLFSLFVNDEKTESLVYRNAKMIHYNCAFNKQMARLNTLLTKHVAEYKTVSKKDGTVVTVPERYTSYGQHIKKTISNMFNSRNLFMEGEMNKLSSALLQYLKKHEVTQLVLSKNLSFAKTEGTVELRKKTKQNFYQIPFGKFLNLIEEKAFHYGISITNIDEAYTSKTSSLTADVNQVKQMAANKEPITSNELNGVRGVKNKKLTRGLFKDNILNTIIHADINAAVNHIKVAFPDCISAEGLLKYRRKLNNPVKLKSANEFSFLLKENSDSRKKEVDIRLIKPALYVHDQV